MKRESRSNYIVRKMQEGRIKPSSPEEEKISNYLGWQDNGLDGLGKVFTELDDVKKENKLLKNNVKELQEQLQNAYKRIKELNVDKSQMELF